jgi:hypothetical protein
VPSKRPVERRAHIRALALQYGYMGNIQLFRIGELDDLEHVRRVTLPDVRTVI